MLTQAEIFEAFSDEAGDAASLSSEAQVARWFNVGQARLGWYRIVEDELTWAEGDTTLALPADLFSVEQLLYPQSAGEDRWEPRNGSLVIEDYDGAQAAGSLKLWYRAYWPDVDTDSASELPRLADAACVAYALSRFFKKLVANRALYNRHATLVGQNAVSPDDLAAAAEEHYQDFIDLRADLPGEPAAIFHREG